MLSAESRFKSVMESGWCPELCLPLVIDYFNLFEKPPESRTNEELQQLLVEASLQLEHNQMREQTIAETESARPKGTRNTYLPKQEEYAVLKFIL
jgi:hypothetical protein